VVGFEEEGKWARGGLGWYLWQEVRCVRKDGRRHGGVRVRKAVCGFGIERKTIRKKKTIRELGLGENQV